MTTILTTFNVGDVVRIRGKGDCAIASVRTIKRGKRTGWKEYVLASLSPDGFGGSTYAMRVIGESLLFETDLKYTKEQIDKATHKVYDTKKDIVQTKEKWAEEGRQALGEQTWKPGQGVVASNMAPGDEVLIRYKGGIRRWEKVVKVNFGTGKVAIARPGSSKGFRWLPATMVEKRRCQHKNLPIKISDRTFDTLAERGWHQVRIRSRGEGLILSSYVVAFDHQDARKQGEDYECADPIVYFDPGFGLHWRSTGSFD